MLNSPFPDPILSQAKMIIERLAQKQQMLVTAESCTGGLIAGALTSIAGSSTAIYGGYITYANEAKMNMIGVPEQVLAQYGAVSEETAKAMADGARKTSGVAYAIAVTGIAGPGGGSVEKPVGLVCFGLATPKGVQTLKKNFGDIGRDGIREHTVSTALQMVQDAVDSDA